VKATACALNGARRSQGVVNAQLASTLLNAGTRSVAVELMPGTRQLQLFYNLTAGNGQMFCYYEEDPEKERK
jgi:hypothetical protein